METNQKKLEIIKLANESLEALENAKIDLKSASGWGVIDILGGGLLTSLIKHNDMDDAQIHMNQAKESLMKLSDELKTMNHNLDFQFDVLDFTDTLDIFVDNIFSDLLVQNSISQAREKIDEVIKKVKEIKNQLEEA